MLRELVVDRTDPRIADYMNVSDAELLRGRGLFVAEGRLVVARLLAQSSLRVRSLLVTESALQGLAGQTGPLADRLDDRLPVYVCDLALMRHITGFNLHRGCLAIGERPSAASVDEIVGHATRLVILEDVADADNVGSVFRNAAAFGADGVLLSPRCCDPLYRKAIRTSMGAALQVPFARVATWPAGLADVRAAGFTIAALMPRADATDITQVDLSRLEPLALLVGHEGAGVSPEAEALADVRLAISMRPGVDSLNVATAAAIALHRFFAGR